MHGLDHYLSVTNYKSKFNSRYYQHILMFSVICFLLSCITNMLWFTIVQKNIFIRLNIASYNNKYIIEDYINVIYRITYCQVVNNTSNLEILSITIRCYVKKSFEVVMVIILSNDFLYIDYFLSKTSKQEFLLTNSGTRSFIAATICI